MQSQQTHTEVQSVAACEDLSTEPQFHIFALTEASQEIYKDISPTASETKSRGDAGIDLRFPRQVSLARGETKKISLDVGVWCCVRGMSVPFYVVPRSSIGKTPLLAEEDITPFLGRADGQDVPAVTCGLTGESTLVCQNSRGLIVTLTNHGKVPYVIEKGVSLFQLADVLLRSPTCVLTTRWVPGTPSLGSVPKKQISFLLSTGPKHSTSKPTAILSIPGDITCGPESTTDISLGVKMSCYVEKMPWAFWLVPFFESSPLVLKNWVGLIDKGFRGELKARVYNMSKKPFILHKGEQAFGALVPFPSLSSVTEVGPDHAEFKPGATLRGEEGFGSTGATGKQ